MDADKREYRKLKRDIKRAGNKRRRQHLKRDLAENPEEAAAVEFDFGHTSSAGLNGMDQDATRRREPRASAGGPFKSRLLEFYRGEAPDAEGRRLADIWRWPDEEWEIVHDFIQWLFPLSEPSRFNPDAPLLTDADMATFRGDERLRTNLRRSFERFLEFLGLAITPEGAVVESTNFRARVPEVWAAPNHNWLRISRALRSLSLLGLAEEARAFYQRLEMLYSSRRFPITEETFRYWTGAVGE